MISPPTKPAPTPLAPSPAPPPGPAAPELPAGRPGPALAYAALALDRMAEMMGDPDPKVALAACREILDRAWGKAEAASRAPGETIVVVIQGSAD